MSSTLESAPAAQKNCHGLVTPRLAPRSPRNASAGIIVMKTPMNTAATSTIGAQLKRLVAWTSRGVVASDSAAQATMPAICTPARR